MNTIVSKHDLHNFQSQPAFEVRDHPSSDARSGGFVPAALGVGMHSWISLLAAGTKFKHVSCHHVCKWRQMYYAVTAGSLGGVMLGLLFQAESGVAQPGDIWPCHGTTVPLLPAPLGPACPGGAEASEREHGSGGLLWNSLIPGARLLPGALSNCTSSPGQCSLLGLPCSELRVWLWLSLYSARLLVRA